MCSLHNCFVAKPSLKQFNGCTVVSLCEWESSNSWFRGFFDESTQVCELIDLRQRFLLWIALLKESQNSVHSWIFPGGKFSSLRRRPPGVVKPQEIGSANQRTKACSWARWIARFSVLHSDWLRAFLYLILLLIGQLYFNPKFSISKSNGVRLLFCMRWAKLPLRVIYAQRILRINTKEFL